MPAATPAPAATPPDKTGKPGQKYSLAPLPKTVKASSLHGPYDAGSCGLCHKNDDAKNPGPITKTMAEMCLDCHDEFKKLTTRKFTHTPAKDNCTACHNPHNSVQPKLLVDEMGSLCMSCHEPIKKLATGAKVKHGAMAADKKCANCHNPHGTDVEHLLVQLPFDLCMKCHSKDDMTDAGGRKLANFKKLLDENPVWHAPVAAKDCSACHKPHGGDHFRLLGSDYPPQFYSPYDAKNYALCFECHNDEMLKSAETTALTQFRDGSRNLHYLHVNKLDRGRTCRACHEVHASTHPHHIRDSVPYGPKGWMLKINFTKTETGGSCERTCHTKKTYTNKPLKTPPPQEKK
ncbi:MAG: cytochrome c3 family protein [Verrucomicrobia bacterium]|nr:cytochrome c3 family protein [Verrucomicrobiota bacterium]